MRRAGRFAEVHGSPRQRPAVNAWRDSGAEVEELIVPLHRKREEEIHRQEGDGEEAVGKKCRVEVLAEGKSQLVLKDEQSS